MKVPFFFSSSSVFNQLDLKKEHMILLTDCCYHTKLYTFSSTK